MPDEQRHQSALTPWLPVLAAVWVLVFTVNFYSLPIPDAQGELDRLDFWFLLPQLVLENIIPEQNPSVPSGWVYLGERIPLILLAGVILAGACATGRLILRALSLIEVSDRPARWALSAGSGLSAISLLTLGCGLAGLLNRGVFWSTLLALLLTEFCMSLRRLLRNQVPSSLQKSSQGAGRGELKHAGVTASTLADPCDRSPTWLRVSAVAAAALFLGPMVLGALLPSTDFDVNEYHFQGPKEFYQNGQITFLPHNIYTSFPFLTEMLTLCGMVLTGDWWQGALVGKLVLMSFAPISALAIFSLTRRLSGETAAWLASLFFLSTPWIHRISIIAYTEGAMCAYVVLTVLALFQYSDLHRQSGAWKVALLTGIVSGSAASAKYPGLVFVTIPAGCVLLWALYGRGSASDGPQSRRLNQLTAFSAGVLLTFGPWLLKNLVETGNPVYPLAYSLFGGVDLNDELHAKWARGHASPPGRFTNLVMFRDRLLDVVLRSSWQSPLLFAFAPCALLVDRPRRREILFLAGGVLFLFLGWYAFTHHIDRFWLHLIPLTAVLAGVGFSRLYRLILQAGEQSEGIPRLAALIALAGLPVLATAGMVYNWAFDTSGLCGPNGYLLKLDVARKLYRGPYSAITTAERELPPDGCVLFVGEAAVFEATYPVRYSTVFDVDLLEESCVDRNLKSSEDPFPLLDREKILKNLRSLGVTHVFVNWDEVLRYRAPGSYGFTDFVSPERFAELVRHGVLEEIPLPAESAYRPWEDKDSALQREILTWGPELKQTMNGTDIYRCYEMYRLAG